MDNADIFQAAELATGTRVILGARKTSLAQQKPMELATLGVLARAYGCETAVEIGTSFGGTARFLHMIGLKVVAVDADLSQVRCRVSGVTYRQGNSHEMAPVACDLLFIDGDHSFDGALRDFELHGPYAKKLIAFHDIVPHDLSVLEPGTQIPEVDRLWQTIRRGLRTIEIVDSDGHDWGGIGVIVV
jgi:hypothetical protein